MLPPNPKTNVLTAPRSDCLTASVKMAVGVTWPIHLAATPCACIVLTDHHSPRGPDPTEHTLGLAPRAQHSGGASVIASLHIQNGRST